MSDLTVFEIIAGSASIISVLLALFHSARKGILTYKQKKQNAEEEFKRELDRLKAAGSSVSARTDLGFFISLELGSQRELISFYRHHRSVAIVATNINLCLFIIAQQLRIETIDIYIMIFAVGTLIYTLVAHNIVIRLQKFTKAYEERVKEVWSQPIDKRLKSLDST